MKNETTVKSIGDALDILMNLSCAVSNLVVLHSAMEEQDLSGPALNDAIYYTAISLKKECDALDLCLTALRSAE